MALAAGPRTRSSPDARAHAGRDQCSTRRGSQRAGRARPRVRASGRGPRGLPGRYQGPCPVPEKLAKCRYLPVCARPPAACYTAKTVRSSSLLFGAALVGLLLPLPLGLRPAHADGASSRPDTMPVSEIHPGMKGYGLTVFQGVKPERFDVEVIDVLKYFRPKQDLILVKTKHPRLEITKVVAGMSGSPIYLNDKMIGAYAYGWSFGSEPVAGVTPIANMLGELARPLPPQIDGWPLKLLPQAGAIKAAPRE